MGVHKFSKGLDIPVTGQPENAIAEAASPRSVAILGEDYIGMKPTMQVQPGDAVVRGQVLFEDKKTPGVLFTAPAAGTVAAVNRGERRAFQSVVIELNAREQAGSPANDDFATFAAYTGKDPISLTGAEVKALLLESGLWTALRMRPFGRVANPETVPHSIFVNAMDTNPLAAPVDAVYAGHEAAFEKGLLCIARLCAGKTFLCRAPGSSVTASPHSGIAIEEFEGPHPAGTVGLHIHCLDPVHVGKTVWHIGYQDVIAIGKLFTTGKLDVARVISLAGPGVKKPRLLRTRLGASLDDLTASELHAGDQRVISGSILSGRAASGPVLGYLGRYHQQISVLPEGRERVFLGWLSPGANQYSIVNTFLSCLQRGKKLFPFTTSLNGAERAMVPIGLYERVMPLDLMPTFLLRSLVCGDLERAEELGCLELDEEDVALCTFVCPSKIEYGPYLRKALTQLEKEG